MDDVEVLSTASGSLVETHDFLQPLERAEENAGSRKMEHVLPGGIGTYSISHISCYNQKSLARDCTTTVPSDHNINSTGFKLWDKSSSSIDKPKPKLPHHKSDPDEPPLKPLTGIFPSPPSQKYRVPSGSKHQSFIEIMRSGRSENRDEDLEDDEESSLKREYSSSGGRGELPVRVDSKGWEQKANTPRSKHSATEQRRRSKINDRFQMLREIIPQTDQKRDKASFLLEVIEYIQFLQLKVRKYEECYPSKVTHWGNRNDGGADDLSPGAHAGNSSAPVFSSAIDDKHVDRLKEHDMRIEGGSISLSNAYSQGLLDTLTRALQTSGVDLTQASLSVQIDIGKQSSACPGSSKDNSDSVPKHEPFRSTNRDSDQPFKKPRIA